jgi:hypothetical protein
MDALFSKTHILHHGIFEVANQFTRELKDSLAAKRNDNGESSS